MPRITKVTTRTGDDGATALGNGQRVPKSHLRINAYGAVDELNAVVGIVLASSPAPPVAAPLATLQNDLFHLGADLCLPEADKAQRPGPRIEERHVAALDALIVALNAQLPPLQNFVLPGGHPVAAHLHLARTICRRAERDAVALAAHEPIGPHVVQYLNRLSDALFLLSRLQNKLAGAPEPVWNSRA